MKGLKYNKRSRRLLFTAVIILTALMCLVCYIEMRVRPIMTESAKSRARAYATTLINEAVGNALTESAALVTLSENGDGISGIATNIPELSKIRFKVMESLTKSLGDPDIMTLSIPLGNLTGSTLMAGRGMPVTVKLVPIGDISADVRTEFIESGINQTMHKITLRVRLTLNVLSAGDMVKLELASDVTLAETIIVGKVPDAYTAINRFEIDEDEENDLNDYAASIP